MRLEILLTLFLVSMASLQAQAWMGTSNVNTVIAEEDARISQRWQADVRKASEQQVYDSNSGNVGHR